MSVLSPHSPRRQRKSVYDATTFERRILMTVPLSRELRRRFHKRSIPIRKGDTVRVMSGSFVGREERVAKIDRRGYSVTLDNVTLKSGEAKLKPLPIRTSHLVLTKLNLADAWRREALQVREEELTPEERGEVVEIPEPETPPALDAPAETKDEGPAVEESDVEDAAPAKAAPARPAKKRAKPAEKEGEDA
jgi:large subunit ribosomal protein L24